MNENSPDYWLARADEARVKAKAAPETETKHLLLKFAEICDRLAALAEKERTAFRSK